MQRLSFLKWFVLVAVLALGYQNCSEIKISIHGSQPPPGGGGGGLGIPPNLACPRVVDTGVPLITHTIPAGKILTNVANASFDLGDRAFVLASHGHINPDNSNFVPNNYSAFTVNYTTNSITTIPLPPLPSPFSYSALQDTPYCMLDVLDSDRISSVLARLNCYHPTNQGQVLLYRFSKSNNSWTQIFSLAINSSPVIDAKFDDLGRPVMLFWTGFATNTSIVQYYSGGQWTQAGNPFSWSAPGAPLYTTAVKLLATQSDNLSFVTRTLASASNTSTFNIIEAASGQSHPLLQQPPSGVSTFNWYIGQAPDSGDIFYDMATWNQFSLNKISLPSFTDTNQSFGNSIISFTPGWQYGLLGFDVVARYQYDAGRCYLKFSTDSGRTFSDIPLSNPTFGNGCVIGNLVLDRASGDIYSTTLDHATNTRVSFSKIHCN